MASSSLQSLQEHLENALLLAREVEELDVDRSELAQLIASSLQQIYRARAATHDGAGFDDAMVLASLEIERAMELLPPSSIDEATRETRARLEAAADESRHPSPVHDTELRLPSPERPWTGARASVDVPVVVESSARRVGSCDPHTPAVA